MKVLPVLAAPLSALIVGVSRATCFFAIALALSACGDDGAPANVPPSASFSVTPSSGVAPLAVTLDASASTDSDGSIASYSWNFGDGTPAELGQRANHTYAAPGTFSITLTVADNRGRSAASSGSVNVREPSWLLAASMEIGRGGFTADPLPDGRVLVTGGYLPRRGADTMYLSSTELYDPVANTWSTVASMGEARAGHTATTLLDGKVLVAGGGLRQEPGLFTHKVSAEIYDSVTKTWSPVTDMSEARSGHTATLLSDGRVLVVGGTTGNSQFPTIPGVELYDPVTNTWSQAANMAATRRGHTATLLPSGWVLVAGGSSTAGPDPAAELYDPVSNSWLPAGQMAEARAGHTATLLPDGKVLVAGGGAPPLATAELYDPGSNSWMPAARMAEVREGNSAILLPNGKVLVAGGTGGDPPGYIRVLASAEIYDPATNSWSPIDRMINARTFAEAEPLPGGSVLVIGGWDGDIYQSSSEIFR